MYLRWLNWFSIVVFLPPYSPDFTPIEEMFSKVKNFIRQHETVFEAAPKEVLSAAFHSVTEQDCIGYIFFHVFMLGGTLWYLIIYLQKWVHKIHDT